MFRTHFTLEKAQTDLGYASKYRPFSKKEELQNKKDTAEQEVENLQKKLEAQQEKTDTKTKEVEVKEAEVQQLQEEGQRMETSLQTLMGEVELKWPLVSRQKFEEEQQREEAEKKVHILEETLQKKLQERDQTELNWTIIDEELKKAKSHLDSKDTKISQLQRHVDELLADNQSLRDVKQISEDVQKELAAIRKELQERDQTELNWTIADEDLKKAKSDLDSKDRELSQLQRHSQAGHFEGSDHSRSVEPPCPPPNTQTSDSGFNIEVNQHGKYIRLINSSTEDKDLGEWELQLQVNNNHPIMHRFDKSFNLRAGGFVTMWAAGYGCNYYNTDLKWKDLKSWSSGDSLKFSLYSHTGEIQYEHCVTFAEIF
ncbi:prelamin-A/C-like [Trematomus bernacchii]|uniref:prelamin-A/C-like n=1 Tax=Trematomus bernacchii TaxID=40690 RepID=UPI00146F3374|nr:prelamin-A/C-like [Trematomus bernacchii]